MNRRIPLCHVHLALLSAGYNNEKRPAHGCKQSTKFEPFVNEGLTCSFERVKAGANYLHVPSSFLSSGTCALCSSASATQKCHLFIQRSDATAHVHQCAKFGVAC